MNFPDTLIVQGKYQIKPELPFTPGAEFAGIVKAVGEGVSSVKPGDAVLGVGVTGGFAEEALIDAANLVPLPAGADFEVAAALTMAYGTSLHALKDRARLAPGETLLVLGAGGGVGLAAVEIGKLLGATVIAAASTDAKLTVCRARGADAAINYDREDLKERVRALTGGRGADVIYDPVGGPYTAAASRSVAWNGRYLVVGFAAGEIPSVPAQPAAAQGLLDRRRALGRIRAARAGRERGQHEAIDGLGRHRQARAARLGALPAVAGRRCAVRDDAPRGRRQDRADPLTRAASSSRRRAGSRRR